MMTVFDLKVGRSYRNRKTQDIYVIIGFARCSETLEVRVTYQLRSGKNDLPWTRPQSLFLEKFEPVME